MRNNFTYNWMFLVELPDNKHTKYDWYQPHLQLSILKKTLGLKLLAATAPRIFVFAQGRLSSGDSVPLKGIWFEGATAGELTFSPTLPSSLWASMAAFNQVPKRCLCSMRCLFNACPRVRLPAWTPTHMDKHPQLLLSEVCQSDTVLQWYW